MARLVAMPMPAASAFSQRDLRLRDRLRAVDAGFDQGARQLERFSIGLDGAVVKILQRVLPAQFEIDIRRERPAR